MGNIFSSSKVSPLSSVGSDTPYIDNGILDLCKTIQQAEYIFHLGAMFSRLAYCDSGIIQECLKAFSFSPDVFEKVITAYDWKYLSLRRSYTKGVPAPDSYTTINSCKTTLTKPLLKYISSPIDTTCMVATASLLKATALHTILIPTDCIITFKGSSSLRNWIANLGSVKAGSLNERLKKLEVLNGVQAIPDFKVTTSYLVPILEILRNILDAIALVSPGCTRIFVFGHSKGGAEAEMMGMLLTLMLKKKENFQALGAVTDVHVISYGAPKILASSAYTEFNRQILSARSTLTRIESVGRLVGDIVTTQPPWGRHPGASDSNNTIDVVRAKYGVKVDGNYRRNKDSWPFAEPFDLSSNPVELNQKVTSITSFTPPTDAEAKTLEQKVGGYYIKVKGAKLTPFPHVEQLGMFFMGSQRLAGMKNPANTTDGKTFTAVMDMTCSSYEYIGYTKLVAVGGKTYRKPKRQLKKTRRG